jgi:hypothetical protein
VAFGRKKASVEADIDVESFEDDLDEQDRALEDAELLAELDRQERVERLATLARPKGPWDLADAPDPEIPRLDLGGLQVTVVPDTDIRVEVSPEGEVVAATIVHGDTALQLNAFAAPRSEGIWAEVRTEIRDALTSSGGQAQEADGFFGTELRAAVPTEVPGQGVVLAPARFVGVDGPRWFLRGLITGPGATEDSHAQVLLEAMKQVVVVRGSDPMAVRDPLPLALPAEAMQAVDEAAAAGLEMPERGPEITETR